MTLVEENPQWEELRREAQALDPDVARLLAEAWARDAQFEHASVASFGRFALELLALGAPPELVAGAHHAALEEIEHARACFSLASIYAGSPLGPGPLPLDPGAFSPPELARAAHATVLEGCVNETLAALEAETALAMAEPAAVRAVLQAIQRQESDHASLAFRFVGWAIAVGGVRVRDAARAAFARADAAIRGGARPPDGSSPIDQALRRHGRLPERARWELRRRALDAVIEPAARALLTNGR